MARPTSSWSAGTPSPPDARWSRRRGPGRLCGRLAALAGFRLLCAHRRGPYGVSTWTSRQQAWLSEAIEDLDLEQRDYVGRPLLVTENDYELGLYNGDTGVIVQSDPPARAGHVRAWQATAQLQPVAPRRRSRPSTR